MSSLPATQARAKAPTESAGLGAHARGAPAELACFALVAATYIAYFLAAGYGRFYWDAREYWRLGDEFGAGGGFSLLSYSDPYRGYSLPLVNHGLKEIASHLGLGDVTTVELAGAMLAAALGVVVLPRLARVLFPNASLSWRRVLALNALVFVYWRGHFNFPLTDFPALTASCLSIVALRRGTVAGYLVAGLGLGLAANLRPAYVPALVVALLVLGLRPLLREWGRRAGAVALLLVGAIAVTLPQALINHHQAGTWKPTPRGSRDISLVQLSGGLVAQRYETFVGLSGEYPRAKVFYVDPAGRRVLQDEGIGGVSSYRQYIRVVAHHPVLMAASYALHVFNGLDVWHPTPYVRHLSDRNQRLSLLYYTLLFGAIARLALREARRRLGQIDWGAITILLSPCVIPIAGAVEPRFFLPVYALAYMLACFGPGTRTSLTELTSQRRLVLASMLIAFVALCVALSAGTRREIEYPQASPAIATPAPLGG